MNNHITKITQNFIEINGKLIFSKIWQSKKHFLQLDTLFQMWNIFQIKIFKKITLYL